MPWKLIGYLAILAIVLVFVGLNLEHRATVSLGFVVFQDVPVFISLGVAFFLGTAMALPFSLRRRGAPKALAKTTADTAAVRRRTRGDGGTENGDS